MTTPYRLSVIITAHNCALWLEETLESVIASLADAGSRCEIVIINDASSDDSQAIIERFAATYPHVRHQQTQLRNIGKVRNHAVSLARGDYILMLDGDDRLLPRAIADHLQILDKQAPDIYLSKIIEQRSGSASKLPEWHFRTPVRLTIDDAITRFLIHRDFQAHFIGQYFRRGLLVENPFPSFICYEDAWLFPQLLTRSKKILFSEAGFYLYRKHASSLSTVMNPEKIACLLAATAHMDEVLPDNFKPLITCHWIDVINRHAAVLKQQGEWDKVKKRICQQNLGSFLVNGKIRMSYKRKMLKVRRLS
ncbi:glucosyltransferase [Mixta theicola]|uniref:Glucosyltransferase n=1 Tax=Mixta theicola TaxID=1458355 RepID=A0A2K1Q6V4_9GAMM|nr:glycosyltransferase family 2 protein [Mixta theicola]PNS10769.1 glucosyltransferase [Mixta theicola]GLR08863.1 glycosyl transferase family 2 [Mixta theicola]